MNNLEKLKARKERLIKTISELEILDRDFDKTPSKSTFSISTPKMRKRMLESFKEDLAIIDKEIKEKENEKQKRIDLPTL